MDSDEKIEKIFGSDRHDKERYQNKNEKIPFVNMDFYSNRKKDNKLLKQQKINISSYQKQFTNVENTFDKKNKKKNSGYIDINNNNDLKSNKIEKEKEGNFKLNKIKKIKYY